MLYKSKIRTLELWLDSWIYIHCYEYWFMSPSGRLIIDCYIGLFGTGFVQVLYMGRAPRTKETMPDFREECRVTRHSRVFRGLTGSQQTPGF